SAASGAVVSIGASGAIFGLLGGLAVINVRYRTQLPLGFRQPLRWWVQILLINSLLPLLLPQIDVWAHVGGFMGGALVTLVVLDRGSEYRPSAPAGPAIRVGALVLGAMYAVGLGTAVWYAARTKMDAEVTLARRIGKDRNIADRWLDNVAFYTPALTEPGDDA